MAEAVAGIALEKAAGSLFDKAKEKIGYMWNCKENVQNLKEEVESLELMKSQVQQKIDIDKSKGDDLIKGVDEWVEKAGQEISKAQVFLGEFLNAKKTCFKIGMCGNWATLYRYGKRATEMMTPLEKHKSNGKDFVTCVYVETPPPTQLDVYQTKNPEDLVTHNSALNAIIAALEDETKQIIGIYGIGGVGKTTLAKEVAAKVKHLFADVAFTTVSQTVKTEEIKKSFENATKRLVKGEKVLIILDDVWKKLDLEELCIPINRTNCRILLTSRNEDVCEKMNAKSKIRVNSLQPKEAWILFTRVVSERVETDADLKPVAEEVAKECGGLPLLIQAVGNALKSKSIGSWKDALSQLKKRAPSEIDPDIGEAFTRLQLSYDYLESEKAKLCFLLCSMFPEDYNICLEDLVCYMVGLEKFDDIDSMEDARVKVRNAVNMLISSCLLLNSELMGEGYTKMHDVVRDVALLIASQGKNKYLVEAGKGEREWLPRNKSLESYTGISLMHNKISKLPDYEVQLSRLDIFLVNHNEELSMISDKFIEGMKEVKVLDMRWCIISHFPQSLKLLTKLRMLNLEGNFFFDEISLLGEMKELEILILNNSIIKEIPKEIGRLVNLRQLEVIRCGYMTRVTPGVISKLRSLEELRIDFRQMSEGVYECVVEVMKLSKLTYLQLAVNSFNLIPEGFNSENLEGFEIKIGGLCELNELRRSDRRVSISRHLVTPILKWLKKLIEVSRPHIFLSKIENLNNIMPDLYHGGFNKLEDIGIERCSNVSCLVNDDGTIRCDGDEGETNEKYFKELKHLNLRSLNKLEVLWKCPDEYISLTKLVTLGIFACDKLERVFTVSVAQGLVNLKCLSVVSCDGLEEVIYGGDDESRNIIVFPSLAQISLSRLNRLKSFHSGGSENCSIKYPSLVDVQIEYCRRMKIWGPGTHETPKLKSIFVGTSFFNMQRVQLDGANAINDALAKKMKQLIEEEVEDDESE